MLEKPALSVWVGEKVRLRGVVPEDWRQFFEWNMDSETARLLYFVPFPLSAELVQKRTAERSLAFPRDDVFEFVIESLAGEWVGSLNTHSCDPRCGAFRYGIAIRREHWRVGYASDAIRLVLRYYFNELRYQKCNVEVFEYNEASLRLHERLGFQIEGRLRRTTYTDGKYYDALQLGLTAEEFFAGR
jgi:RimJ/RimL family protein N-acetyltransferase